jgi:hypothetical protein
MLRIHNTITKDIFEVTPAKILQKSFTFDLNSLAKIVFCPFTNSLNEAYLNLSKL